MPVYTRNANKLRNMNLNPPTHSPFYTFRAFRKSINVVYIVIARRLLVAYRITDVLTTTTYSSGHSLHLIWLHQCITFKQLRLFQNSTGMCLRGWCFDFHSLSLLKKPWHAFDRFTFFSLLFLQTHVSLHFRQSRFSAEVRIFRVSSLFKRLIAQWPSNWHHSRKETIEREEIYPYSCRWRRPNLLHKP